MTSKLKSYTIVPDSLYIERKADKQLHHIIESMQRPGYVLVSRQMGKTNLLLRAKRKWENNEDLYVYIDMSNINESEKECFEYLIDTAIETHEEQLSSIKDKIADLRKINISKSPVQAHNEELRTLLQNVKGKLVFILDEIDSLTRTTFSDNIFSQIRSIFFSRVNYPVLEKLTYVLSGVVEPTEIIKNPKISPFNIGEKILLEDFSHDEYLKFIYKAELDEFGEDVIDRIFYWAEGNPRLTWDICYELQYKQEITVAAVDALVKNMYLTSFDKAPIDTIRNIVKEDRDLREAIIQIAYNKGRTLSDKVKNKLYLAGIVNYEDNDVRIKNRIIKDSLSVNWLQKLEEEEKGLLAYAIELHSKGLYSDSISKFELFLKNNEFSEANAPIYYYFMGSCYYHLMDFKKSLEFLSLKPLDYGKNPYEYRHANFLAGADCLKIDDYKQSLDYFNNAMRGEEKDWVYYSAKLNALSARKQLARGNLSELQDIEQNYNDLLALPDTPSNVDIKFYAATQLAEMYKSTDIHKVIEVYNEALKSASGSIRIRLLVHKFEIAESDNKQEILDELIKSIEQINDLSTITDPDRTLDIDEEIFTQILYLIYTHAYDKWFIVKEKLSLLPYSYGDALYHVFCQSFTSHIFHKEGTSRLIQDIYDNLSSTEYNISPSLKLSIYKNNAFFNYSTDKAKEYVKLFMGIPEKKLDAVGLVIFRSYAIDLLNSKQYRAIIDDLSWMIDYHYDGLNHQDIKLRAYIDYALLFAYYEFADEQTVQQIAKLILSYIDDEIDTSTGNERRTLLQVKESAASVVIIPTNPYIKKTSYRRNDRVKVQYITTNQIVEKKFKYLQQDIEEGRCVIIPS